MSVTVLIGARGGVGTTTHAMQMIRGAARPVTGIDMDLSMGDLAWRFGVRLRTSLADLATIGDERVNIRHVEMLRYEIDKRSSIIGSPAHVELAELVYPEHVATVIELISRQGDVVIDAGCRLDICGLSACRQATNIRMVAADTPSNIRQLQTLVDLWDRAGVDAVMELVMPFESRKCLHRTAKLLGVNPVESSRLSRTTSRSRRWLAAPWFADRRSGEIGAR